MLLSHPADRPKDKLGVIFFPAYDWAIAPEHPEREERLLYTQDQLREEGLFDFPGLAEYRPAVARPEDVARVHILPLGLRRVAGTPHLISAGGAMEAGRLVMSGRSDKAFALVRPPGHHAMRVVHGGRGFCNINNEAIMIEYLRHRFGPLRVAVVDTDCHHGDGTQDIYWHDPDTLFISLHQDGRTLYPGTGFPNELGGPKALGSTINIPLPPKTGDEGFIWATENIVRPLLDEWKPDLVINSAGQDNHFSDPITNMRLTARGYARLVELIDPHIAVLEGGYAVKGALPYLNLAIAMALAGLDYSRVEEPLPPAPELATPPATMEYLKLLAEELLKLARKADPMKSGYRREGDWWVRQRGIYYDTHGIDAEEGEDQWGDDDYWGSNPAAIHEHQREELYDCPHCPGLLIIRTQSELSQQTVHQVLPRQACERCRALAEASN